MPHTPAFGLCRRGTRARHYRAANRHDRRSAMANYELGRAAQTTGVLAADETVRSGEFACLMVGVLADRKPQTFGDAVVADGLGGEPPDEAFDIVQNRHMPLPPGV